MVNYLKCPHKKGDIMPKKPINKEPIDKDIFMEVIRSKGSSIRKLGGEKLNICDERTIRRSLHEKKMTPSILEKIAKHLDIDPRYLSGKFHREISSIKNQDIKEQWLKRLKPINYPYIGKALDDQHKIPIEEFFEKMFSLFDISNNQYESLELEKQYELQYAIFNSIIPVLKKYFNEDGYGQKGLPNIERIIFDLENHRVDYYVSQYANTILREKFIENPPHGFSKEKIRSMSSDELIGLELYEQSKNEEPSEFEKKLYEKYNIKNLNE